MSRFVVDSAKQLFIGLLTECSNSGRRIVVVIVLVIHTLCNIATVR